MATSTVQQVNRQAPFMEDYIRKLLESAYQQTQDPVDLPLQKVADLDPNQIRAGELINQGIGQYQPLINQATQLISDPNAYQQFMSPYTSDVIDQVGKDINRQTAIQQNQLSAGAQGAGAFGGSRMGVAQGEIGRAGLDQFADTSARLREAGFTTAQNLVGQRAGQLGQMAATGQQLGQQDISNLLGIGSLYQGQAQAIADAQRANALQSIYEPYQRLGFFSDILRGVPSSSSTLQFNTAPDQSPLSQILGTAATGLGIAGQLGYKPFA